MRNINMFQNDVTDNEDYESEIKIIEQENIEAKNLLFSTLKFDENLREKIEELFNYDPELAYSGKEHVILSKAVFKIPHSVIAFKKIKRIHEIFLEENTKKCYKLVWSRPYPKDHWNPLSQMKGARQICGDITILPNNLLIAETRGKTLMIELIFIIRDILGENIELKKLRLQDPLEILKNYKKK